MIDIATLKNDQPEVKSVAKALAKATGQTVPIINIGEKVKRESNVSTRSVEFMLSGNQKVLFLVRQGGDVFRVKINGKDFPFEGNLSLSPEAKAPAKSSAVKQGGAGIVESKGFDHAIGLIGTAVRNAQSAFEDKQRAEKVIVPMGNRQASPSKQLQALQDELSETDKIIADKTQIRDALLANIAQRQAQLAAPPIVEGGNA